MFQYIFFYKIFPEWMFLDDLCMHVCSRVENRHLWSTKPPVAPLELTTSHRAARRGPIMPGISVLLSKTSRRQSLQTSTVHLSLIFIRMVDFFSFSYLGSWRKKLSRLATPVFPHIWQVAARILFFFLVTSRNRAWRKMSLRSYLTVTALLKASAYISSYW